LDQPDPDLGRTAKGTLRARLAARLRGPEVSRQAVSEFLRLREYKFPFSDEGLDCFQHFAQSFMPENVKASKFYRRFKDRYVSPKGFGSWSQEIAKFSCFATPLYFETQFYANQGEIYPKSEETGRFLGSIVHSYFYKSPAFYISEEMAEALSNTVVPPMAEPKKVIESFYLVLPKSYLGKINVHPATGSTVVLAQTGKSHQKGLGIASRLFNVAIENPPYEKHPFNPKNAGMHSFVVGANVNRGELSVNYVDGYWDTEYKTDDGDNGKWLVNIIKNIILLHNYDQKRFEAEKKPRQQTSGRGFRLDSIRAEYPITWVGKNYQRQRTAQDPTDPDQPRRIFKSHWRKGHWHHYWAGVGRKEKILKWVQPVYVKGINLHS